jgi:hypothetical protein
VNNMIDLQVRLMNYLVKVRQSLYRPRGFHGVYAPRIHDNRHMKVVRFSALRTGSFYPPGDTPGTHFCQRMIQSQGHSAAGRIMSMEKSNEPIGKRTCDLPACSAVPQLTASWRAPTYYLGSSIILGTRNQRWLCCNQHLKYIISS